MSESLEVSFGEKVKGVYGRSSKRERKEEGERGREKGRESRRERDREKQEWMVACTAFIILRDENDAYYSMCSRAMHSVTSICQKSSAECFLIEFKYLLCGLLYPASCTDKVIHALPNKMWMPPGP